MSDRKIRDSISLLLFSCPTIFLPGNSFDQNSIFNPNWAFLAPKALVDLPKSGLDVSPTGGTRFTRLKRLKNSARKRRLAPSLPRNQGILVFFARTKSVLA